jgi:hypothetical protein
LTLETSRKRASKNQYDAMRRARGLKKINRDTMPSAKSSSRNGDETSTEADVDHCNNQISAPGTDGADGKEDGYDGTGPEPA